MFFITDNYLGHTVEGNHVCIWVYSWLKGCLTTTRLAILTSLHIVERLAVTGIVWVIIRIGGFRTMIYEQFDTSTPLYAAYPDISFILVYCF